MTDDRGRKRDTPDGVFGSGAPNKKGPAPRGAGLSGSLPGGSRYASHEQVPGSVPITIQNEPRRIGEREEPRRVFEREPHEPARGAWEGGGAPSRRPGPPEPPMAAPRSPAPHRPQTVRGVDGFAATRPAEPVPPSRGPSMSTLDPMARGPKPPPSARPQERSGPPRAPEGKASLRLKLEGDTYYEAHEGRVRVPKRRGPVFFGVLVLLVVLAGGAFLWIDAHGGVSNFVAALRHVIDPSAPDPSVQTSLTYVEPPQAQAPAAAPSGAQPPAAAPAAQPPAAAAQRPAAAEPKPSEPQLPGQIATGEVEAPEDQPAVAQPANETGAKPEQPVEAKPKPKPAAPVAAKPKPKPKPPVKREPVLKVQPLGDVLNAAPPDPSGAPVLPPPDPPAPE